MIFYVKRSWGGLAATLSFGSKLIGEDQINDCITFEIVFE